MSSAEESDKTGSVNREPQVEVQYSVPSFEAPYPDRVKEMVSPNNTIFNWGGVKIAKISSEIVVKFGPHVTLTEAKNMVFVEDNTRTVPVPKVFAYYTHGPFNRDADDYGSLYDTYIFMSFIEGQSLDRVWETYDSITKAQISTQLKDYIGELRQIGNGNGSYYIGSVGPGPVTDPILENYHNKGPFTSEDEFNNTLVKAYQAQAPKRHIKNLLSGMLSQRKHRTVFTHGDLRLANIMVNDGYVTGIVDWEFSGWYPEYWEFAKALVLNPIILNILFMHS
ncbi:hypothetical protein CBS63078_1696 [Aspergillus niger]|nr:hypothetical protein CBS133816_9664 [Aspergillus niger]KAI2846283.1 hypothetical protein CBS11350_3823 [Aspergillus niger]KAI2884488.1 hypothetical protein CBS11852_8738 [Aspergillus niger]KAI2899000.1 hypothetical protein CBS13152_2711 [Aspergillus niger]KAI2914803.1 hypothetical protein CBS147371_6023 [Aspergillus niger]